MTPISVKRMFQLYISNALVYGTGLLLLRYIPFYRTFLSGRTQMALLYLFLAYLLFSPLYYAYTTTKESENQTFRFLRGINKVFHRERWQREERTAALFLGVKFFFLPLMLGFFLNNLFSLREEQTLYPLLLSAIFTLDTFIFALGYTFEGKALGNAVRSVEPTLFGWVVALMCYPPFNGIVGKYVPWGANDYNQFASSSTLTILLQIVVIGLLIIYVWASIALGLKASNLTNRGIVGRFPYSIVRHPAYASKVGVWWLTLLPVMSLPFALGMLFWTIIYFFRAMTEERHLGMDPEYGEYCKNVKYRFIPYIL